MPTLTIKNIPERLARRLKQGAAQHRRSVNSEAIACLERVLTCTRVDPEEYLARVRAARARLTNIYVTEKDLREAKNWGRP